jgi:L-asparaginase II
MAEGYGKIMAHTPNPVLVEFTRGETLESAHRGAVAVCDAAGKVHFKAGDIQRPVFPRSAFKMMQALPLVETGAADAYGLSGADLSLACASHSGEAFHVKRVGKWLKTIGCKESDLACGPHLPFHETSAHAMIRAEKKPSRLHNNCSGKHSGFLCTACHMGEATEDYVSLRHPVQKRVRKTIAELCGVKPADMAVGIDGCAAPNFALPLTSLATGFARLANPAGLTSKRADAVMRLMQAVREFPLFESGTGRSDALLMAEVTGGTMTKAGAEGVHAAAIPSLGLGVIVKIDDGAARAVETAMAAILLRLGVLPKSSRVASLYLDAPVRNWRGDVCGVRRATKTLSV